jgi:hypothetical protein
VQQAVLASLDEGGSGREEGGEVTSDLPITGECYGCNKPVDGKRFCCDNCRASYSYHKRHGTQPTGRKLKQNRVKQTVIEERGFEFSSRLPSWDVIEKRINRIVMRERERVQP